jgi:hypothetical protein
LDGEGGRREAPARTSGEELCCAAIKKAKFQIIPRSELPILPPPAQGN